MGTKTVHVCTTCGSPRLLQDAYVPLNDPDNVILFDAVYCEDCGEEAGHKRVSVPESFDESTDFYKEIQDDPAN